MRIAQNSRNFWNLRPTKIKRYRVNICYQGWNFQTTVPLALYLAGMASNILLNAMKMIENTTCIKFNPINDTLLEDLNSRSHVVFHLFGEWYETKCNSIKLILTRENDKGYPSRYLGMSALQVCKNQWILYSILVVLK